MEKLPEYGNKKEKTLGQKLKTAILAGASVFASNLAIAEEFSKESIRPVNKTEQTKEVDLENGKDNLRKVFEIIFGNRRDKTGEDLLVHMGGPDGFYRLTPSFLKKLVILSDIEKSKESRISDMQIHGLSLKIKDRIIKEAERVSERDLTNTMKEIRQAILGTNEQMK